MTNPMQELLDLSGLNAVQAARLLGTTARAVHAAADGRALSPLTARRLQEVMQTVRGLPAETPTARLSLLLDSSKGSSIYHQLLATVRRGSRTRYPLPVTERFASRS